MSDYLKDQLITYLGNKRKMVPIFQDLFQEQKQMFTFFDGFSGSGVVSRVAKVQDNIEKLYVNDWEEYSYKLNKCYLSNPTIDEQNEIMENILNLNKHKFEFDSVCDYIYGNYSPIDDENIQIDERVYYTSKNAKIIDNIRHMISKIDENKQHYYIAPLLYKCSVHVNTCGYFNSFYKENGIGKFGGKNENDMKRICGEITLPVPLFHVNRNCDVNIYNMDTNDLVKSMDSVDIAYYDPPYNKHPYSTYYFMLNVISKWNYHEKIPNNLRGQKNDWSRSLYNSFNKSKDTFQDLIENTKAREIWVSYNNQGLISIDDMLMILSKYGHVVKKDFEHPTYNKLIGQGKKFRQKSDSRVKESFFILKRNK